MGFLPLQLHNEQVTLSVLITETTVSCVRCPLMLLSLACHKQNESFGGEGKTCRSGGGGGFSMHWAVDCLKAVCFHPPRSHTKTKLANTWICFSSQTRVLSSKSHSFTEWNTDAASSPLKLICLGSRLMVRFTDSWRNFTKRRSGGDFMKDWNVLETEFELLK